MSIPQPETVHQCIKKVVLSNTFFVCDAGWAGWARSPTGRGSGRGGQQNKSFDEIFGLEIRIIDFFKNVLPFNP